MKQRQVTTGNAHESEFVVHADTAARHDSGGKLHKRAPVSTAFLKFLDDAVDRGILSLNSVGSSDAAPAALPNADASREAVWAQLALGQPNRNAQPRSIHASLAATSWGSGSLTSPARQS